MAQATRQELVAQAKATAEEYFRQGKYFCSEAVVQTINDLLGKPMPQEVVKMASGFPVGIGKSGCVCGAISGGVMALGMVYGRTAPGQPMPERMLPAAAALHDYIRDLYKSTCCRVLVHGMEFGSPERKNHCIKITGLVAEWVANELLAAQEKQGCDHADHQA
ncbi:MAG: C-GCAxxG-C-C family protein [Chloroflexota bacterium]